MAKFLNDVVRNAAFDHLALNADRLVLLTAAPTDYADATTLLGSGGKMVGSVSLSGSDFTQAAGDASGRKVTVAQKNLTINAAGSDLFSAGTEHVAIVDDGNSRILAYTAASVSGPDTVDNGDTIQVAQWDVEIGAAA